MEYIADQEILRKKVKEFFPKKGEIAAEIGISTTQFSKWLHGKEVGASTVFKLNQWLNENSNLRRNIHDRG